MTGSATYLAPRHGWTCFHCGDHFPSTVLGIEAARKHFGPTPDWTPECIERRTVGTDDLLQRVRQAEADALQFRQERDVSDAEAEAAHAELSSLRARFPGAVSVHDAWQQFHSMEGRALAAEAIVSAALAAAPEVIRHARELVCGPGDWHDMPLSDSTPATQAGA